MHPNRPAPKFSSASFCRALPFVLAFLLFFTNTVQLWAHPLGNFTINHYARLEAGADQLRVRYVLDFAEIPTFQEKQQMDTNRDGVFDVQEQTAYLDARAPRWISNLKTEASGQRLALRLEPGSAQIEFLPGQGGLEAMRVSVWLHAPLTLDAKGTTITFADNNYSTRLGWREIVARAVDGAAIQSSNVPAQTVSQELTAYPETMLTEPLNQRAADFVVIPSANRVNPNGTANSPLAGARGIFSRTNDEFGKLFAANQELTPWVLLVSFFAAMALGAFHAFSPGHGKAVVGAYLVGTRGTWPHAVLLGLIVTATHTAGVYALGAVTLFLSAYILPEQLFPWLGFISGALVAVIGLQLLIARVRAARNVSQPRIHTNAHIHTHAEGTMHSHVHSHAFENVVQADAHARDHAAEIQALEKPNARSLLALGISGGLLPCPSALVVMLSAIALGRVWYGFFLIVGFSIGLAGVLVLVGLTLLYAGKFAARSFGGRTFQFAMRYLPIAGALLVSILGVAIALDAFFQTGIVP